MNKKRLYDASHRQCVPRQWRVWYAEVQLRGANKVSSAMDVISGAIANASQVSVQSFYYQNRLHRVVRRSFTK